MIEQRLASVLFFIVGIIVLSALGFAATFIPDDEGRTLMSRVFFFGSLLFAVVARLRFWDAVERMGHPRSPRGSSETSIGENGAH